MTINQRAGIAFAAAVLAGILGIELAYGAPAPQAVLYLGYQAVFVVVPGCLVVRALSPGGARLRGLVFGFAVGNVMATLVFAATAAAGARGVFFAYPPAACLLALIARRGKAGVDLEPPRVSRPIIWAALGLCLVAVAYVAI